METIEKTDFPEIHVGWDSYSDEFLEEARKGAVYCQVCHGMGFVGSTGTCNCCAAGAWARRLMEKESNKKSKHK